MQKAAEVSAVKQTELAYQLGLLFDKKVVAYYRGTYKNLLGQVQVQVLDDLYENRPARPQEIADRLNIPKQHASKILSRLEELELAGAVSDPTDRRSRLYDLTEKGLTLLRSHMVESDRHFETLLAALDKDEQQALQETMETMIGLLQKL